MHSLRLFAVPALLLAANCREYRPADPLRPRVEPVVVEFSSPQTVVLRRASDSVLTGVSRLEGTLVWSDRDSVRLGVTGVELAGSWRPVQAPSDAVIPITKTVRVAHRVLSPTKTLAVIGAAWAATVAIVAASLK